jgi:hypothetical protein
MTIDAVLAYQPPMTTVVVQNMTNSVLVIASDPRRTHEVTFGGKGATDGSDFQHMPPEIVRTPAFARQLSLGTLRVVQGEDDPIVQAALRSQSDAFWKRSAEDRDAALATIDEKADDDYAVGTCIGPGTRPDRPCAQEIPYRVRDAESFIPLCDRHQHLKDQAVKRGSNPWVLEPV